MGNHSIYAARILAASEIIAFEPNPHAALILRAKFGLNRISATVYEVGLSDHEGAASVVEPINNLGAAKLVDATDGVPVRRGDDLLAGVDVGFLKMDAEGWELHALAGLTETIRRCRPVMFVEVDNLNIPEFRSLMEELGYEIVQAHRRYAENENFLVATRQVAHA